MFVESEYEFALTVEFEAAPVERSPVAGCDACCLTKYATEHRGDGQREILAGAEVVSDPHRPTFQVLVVVARFEVQPPAVGRKRGLRVDAAIGQEISVS